MKRNRVNEMMETMKAFSKDKYQKRELLTEMLALQQEMVGIAFNGENIVKDDLRIWDVEKHLEMLNQECGNVADEELARFKKESKIFCNLIKAEISGSRGEAKAFRTLHYIHSKNKILKNVELSEGEIHTELDAVVITPGVITIVEVKNTAKDIFIDENGDYYRTGEFLRWDYNIAEKMIIKEELLKKVLLDSGIDDIQIRSIVVFTDNRIEVQNKYPRITTCFASQLAYIIDGFNGSANMNMSEEDIENIGTLIKEAECKEAYHFKFNVKQYKLYFLTLVTILEEARTKTEESENEQEVTNEKEGIRKAMIGIFTPGHVGSVAAATMIAMVSTIAISAIKKVYVLR